MSEAPVSIAGTAAWISALEASLAPANAALAAHDLLVDTLSGQIGQLPLTQFGASSEKLGHELELALEYSRRSALRAEAAEPGLAAR